MSQILNKYKDWRPILVPVEDRYLDFVLSKSNANTIEITGDMTKKCLVSFIDTRLDECIGSDGSLVSSSGYTYENAVNDGVLLKDIGFTGIDNGLIIYDSGITLNEFVDILTGSTYETSTGDTKLYLRPVFGNSGYYNYDAELTADESEEVYYAFKGGFLQGFYKLGGFNYQILPKDINRAWNLEFVIRPRKDYEVSGVTLNSLHPENNGIFFYMGTRAENKFARFYGADMDVYPDRPNYSGICFDSCDKEYKRRKEHEDFTDSMAFLYDLYLRPLSTESCCKCNCGCIYPQDKEESGETITGITFCDVKLETSNGHILDDNQYFEVITDNGYLIYDRTKDGYTTKTWKRGDTLQLIQKKIVSHENLYLLMNRTASGLTTHTLEEYLKTHSGNTSYNIINDIKDNAFALKVNDDGSVGYKYYMTDCDNENGYSVVSESTYSGMIKDGEWNVVNVMFKILDSDTDKCGNSFGNRKMRIYLYVNGYLKFVSKELPEFRFRELDDYSDKQEGVPFNISLGGGTQGMAESMWTDNYTRPFCKVLPLEENFGGTFIGDIRSFKFYDCQLQYNEIKNNYLYETEDKGGGSVIREDVIYYGFGNSAMSVVLNGNTLPLNKNIRSRYTATSLEDNTHFYAIMSKKYRGTIPVEFTCGGAPMVMYERIEKIDNKECIVFESGAIYGPGTSLSVLSDNI